MSGTGPGSAVLIVRLLHWLMRQPEPTPLLPDHILCNGRLYLPLRMLVRHLEHEVALGCVPTGAKGSPFPAALTAGPSQSPKLGRFELLPPTAGGCPRP